ncbi:hypothetical protein QOL99_01655 [Deinococcus sp. MIMF12]|uniref:Uncharacterized protein n=1 Tax=Deinococcus rhizophilus TaxID=3049544 RepID=A0ABT7JCT3_9DEIO|nr:hypothetical protein [Deinococcus rhizophilus]MDL2342846.1 hypothetical protein [Deinococcus rhizophilus]
MSESTGLLNGRWRGKKLRQYGFLGLTNLHEFCQQYGIDLSEVDIYEEEPKPPRAPAVEKAQEDAPPLGDPPYGVWLNWPGIFSTGGTGTALSFPSLEAAQAWIEQEDLNPEAVQVRSLGEG